MPILINQGKMEAGLPKLELDLNPVKLAREKSEDKVFLTISAFIGKARFDLSVTGA